MLRDFFYETSIFYDFLLFLPEHETRNMKHETWKMELETFLVYQFYVLQHISKNNGKKIFLFCKNTLLLVDQRFG